METTTMQTPAWSLIVIRHPATLNANPGKIRQILETHLRHPGACDEFWFATGSRKTIPDLERECESFAQFRSLCEKAGIVLSYQQGLTLGHSANHDGLPRPGEQTFPADAWQVGPDGAPIPFLCPRSPFVLDYEREYAKTVLRIARPGSYWLDDDLRLGVFKPNGCFCDRCIAAFNTKTGGRWTREELAARLFDKSLAREPLRALWSDFNAKSLAVYAAEVRKAADELGSPCRLAYQSVWADCLYPASDYRPLLEALSGAERRPVGIRPGAGFYNEAEPRGMVRKCLSVAREAERCRGYGGLVATVCYEQETYTRRMLHKSPGAILTECALALASGCDSLSLYWFPAEEPMPVGEYDRFLSALSRARPYFERLAASTRRTRLGGVARFVGSAAAETSDFDLRDETDFDLACAGIPVTVAGPGACAWYLTDKSRYEMTEAEKEAFSALGAARRTPPGGCAATPLSEGGTTWERPPSERGDAPQGQEGVLRAADMPSGMMRLISSAFVDVSDMGQYPLASRRTKLLDDLDAATGGAFPVRIDECRPLRILPRVREDGRLDSVTLLNLSIGGTDEIHVRVRRPVSRSVLLQTTMMTEAEPVAYMAGATADEIVVNLRDIGPWQIVTLFFCQA